MNFQSQNTRQWLRILGLMLGLSAFLLALHSIRLENLGSILLASLNGYSLLAIAVWGLSILSQAWRWRAMLSPQANVPFDTALKLYVVNRLTNLLFVFRAGEAVRIVATHRAFGISIPYLMATFVNERLMNAIFLVGIAFGLTFSISHLAPFRLLLGAALIGTLVALAWLLRKRPPHLEPGIRSRPANGTASGRFKEFSLQFLSGAAILRIPSILGATLLSTAASWCCLWLGILSLLQNIGPSNPLVAALAVLLFINVVSLLPLTPSSVGPFQWGCIFALSFFAVGQTEAVAFSLLLQAVRIVAALFVGGLLFAISCLPRALDGLRARLLEF